MKYVALCTGAYSDFMAEGYYLLPNDFHIDISSERKIFIEDNRNKAEQLKRDFGRNYSDDRVVEIWLENEFCRWLIQKYNLDQYEIIMHEWHVMDNMER